MLLLPVLMAGESKNDYKSMDVEFGPFAIDPNQAVEPLITRCLEAAISWDTRIDTLTNAGLIPSQETKPGTDNWNSDASPANKKRGDRRKK